MSLRRLAKVFSALVVAVALGAVVAPSAALTPAIATGVTVQGTSVGGLGTTAAKSRIESRLASRLRLTYDGQVWTFRRGAFGALELDRAVSAALAADDGARVPLQVRVDHGAVSQVADRLSRQLSKPVLDARLVGLDAAGRPVISPEQTGIAVHAEDVSRLLLGGLTRRSATFEVPSTTLVPHRTKAGFGPVIVINRGANTLRLFDGSRLVRGFRVATGQARYPTPSGTFEIVTMQENPWWIPPPNSDWARGLKPIPPGPGNPLGTRWMGLSAPGVGIHGTPSDASIGYSQSHGCIRMHIPEAVWLFQHVSVGTPVVIV